MPAGWRTAGTPVRQQQIRVPARRLLVEVRVRRMRHRQDAGSRRARTQMRTKPSPLQRPGMDGPRTSRCRTPRTSRRHTPRTSRRRRRTPHSSPRTRSRRAPAAASAAASRRPAHQLAQQLAQQPPVFRCSGVPVMRPVFRHHHRDHHRAVMSIRGRAAPHTFRLPPPIPGHIWSPRAF